MIEPVPVIASLIGMLVALVVAAVIQVLMRRSAHSMKQRMQALEEYAKHQWEVGLTVGPVNVRRVVESWEDDAIRSAELLQRIEKQVLARIVSLPHVSKEDVQREIDAQVADLHDRIAKVESRFPEEAKLEKIASINDALLTERIDQLSKHVENLEQKVLTKWDVALVVSAMIAAIAFVVGSTYAVLGLIGAS